MSLHGSTRVVAAEPSAWFKRWFQGPVFDVHADGAVLRATPNHPVLTHAGWAPARTVPVGGYVVVHDARTEVTVGERHDQRAADLGALTLDVFGRDFHGDGGRFPASVVLEDPPRPLLRPLVGEEGTPPAVSYERLWAVLGCLSTPAGFGCSTWQQACVKVPDLARVWPRGEPSRRATGVDPVTAARLGAALVELPQPPVDPDTLSRRLLGMPGGLRLARVEAVVQEQVGAYVHDVTTTVGCYTAGGVVVG